MGIREKAQLLRYHMLHLSHHPTPTHPTPTHPNPTQPNPPKGRELASIVSFISLFKMLTVIYMIMDSRLRDTVEDAAKVRREQSVETEGLNDKLQKLQNANQVLVLIF